MGKEKPKPQDLQVQYEKNLHSLRARMDKEPRKLVDDGLPTVKYSFAIHKGPGADVKIPLALFPNLNGGRPTGEDDLVGSLLTELEARQSLHHHLGTRQDPRHVSAIEFFVANWEVIATLLHPHGQDLFEPRAFTEIDIGRECGPVDFMGVARDGSLFVAEFGRGSSKHAQLHRYLRVLETLYPDHVRDMHPFLVTPLHNDSSRRMQLRASSLHFNTGSPANGDPLPH